MMNEDQEHITKEIDIEIVIVEIPPDNLTTSIPKSKIHSHLSIVDLKQVKVIDVVLQKKARSYHRKTRGIDTLIRRVQLGGIGHHLLRRQDTNKPECSEKYRDE